MFGYSFDRNDSAGFQSKTRDYKGPVAAYSLGAGVRLSSWLLDFSVAGLSSDWAQETDNGPSQNENKRTTTTTIQFAATRKF